MVRMSTTARKFATRCIHAGYRATPHSPAVVAPLVQSTTFLLDDASYQHMLEGRADKALIYTRLGNPTLDVVQAGCKVTDPSPSMQGLTFPGQRHVAAQSLTEADLFLGAGP